MRSPTERSLKYMRDRGYTCHIVEKWIYVPIGAGVWEPKNRVDMWGLDIVCVHPEKVPVAVQTTSASNHSARVKKMLAIPELLHLARFITVEVHSWGVRKKDGKDAYRGRIERLEFDMNDMPTFVPCDEVWAQKRGARKREAAEKRRAYFNAMYGGS